MKRGISSLVIASAILTGTAFTPVGLNEVSAASFQQQKANEKKETVLSTDVKKKKVYTLEELAAGLVSGNTYNPQWVNNSSILVTNETEVASRSLLINTASKRPDFTINATELVVSPDGKQAIYSNENGFVYLVNLVAGIVKPLNINDDSVKLDFVWSKDGQDVYFIKGEKSDEVSSIDLSTGAIKGIFKDTLIYKTDLRLSDDGKKILYIVGKEGITKTTEGDEPEVVSIDLTGTEDQFYVINLEDEKPEGVALTTSTDNKVSPAFLQTGNVVYISANADSDKNPELKVINASGKDVKVSTLVENMDIISFKVTAEGKIMLLAKVDENFVIYEVNPDTKALTKVAETKLVLTSFNISNDGKSIAATTPGENGDVVVVYKNGEFIAVTK